MTEPKDVIVKVELPAKKAKVKLIGEDGNAYNLIGLCVAAGKKAGYTPEQIKAFRAEAMSAGYDNVLTTCMTWFEVR